MFLFASILIVVELLFILPSIRNFSLPIEVLAVFLCIAYPLYLLLHLRLMVSLNTNNKILEIHNFFHDYKVLINTISDMKIIWVAGEAGYYPYVRITYVSDGHDHKTKFGIRWFDRKKLQNIVNLISQTNHSLSSIDLSNLKHG